MNMRFRAFFVILAVLCLAASSFAGYRLRPPKFIYNSLAREDAIVGFTFDGHGRAVGVTSYASVTTDEKYTAFVWQYDKATGTWSEVFRAVFGDEFGGSQNGLVVDDFNDDQIPDFIVGNKVGKRLYCGNAVGGYDEQPFEPGDAALVLVAGDYDGDRYRDVLGVPWSGDLSVSHAGGTCTFSSIDKRLTTITGNDDAEGGYDLNGDGIKDTVIMNGGGPPHFTIYSNAFPYPIIQECTIPTGRFVNAIALGDFNNDGRADIAVASNASSPAKILIYYQNAAGGLDDPVVIDTSTQPEVLVRFTDSHGHDGLIAVYSSCTSMSVYEQKATGGGLDVQKNFAAPPDASFNTAAGVSRWDINGDGIDDVVGKNDYKGFFWMEGAICVGPTPDIRQLQMVKPPATMDIVASWIDEGHGEEYTVSFYDTKDGQETTPGTQLGKTVSPTFFMNNEVFRKTRMVYYGVTGDCVN